MMHRPGQRIGHYKRRRSEEVGFEVWPNAAFEVSVPGQNGTRDEVAICNGFGDRRRERTGVPDTGCAAIADNIEPERVEVILQTRLLEIFADHLRAWRGRGFHPRLNLEALFTGFLGHEARRHHNGRVGGVRTRCNRGNHDIAVVEGVICAFNSNGAIACWCFAKFISEDFGEMHICAFQIETVLRAFRT